MEEKIRKYLRMFPADAVLTLCAKLLVTFMDAQSIKVLFSALYAELEKNNMTDHSQRDFQQQNKQER